MTTDSPALLLLGVVLGCFGAVAAFVGAEWALAARARRLRRRERDGFRWDYPHPPDFDL